MNKVIQTELLKNGFNTIEEANEAGYEMVDGKLYLTAEQAFKSEREEVLDRLDGVIEYLRGEKDQDVAGFMIRELESVEQYIKERY